jgi:hypothetical protein
MYNGRMKRFFLLFVLLFLASPVALFANDADLIFRDINEARTINGLSPLSSNAALSRAALSKAHFIAGLEELIHTPSNGGVPWSYLASEGYQYSQAGENLATVFDTASTTTLWLSSSAHRANILNSSFVHIGIAIVPGEFNEEKTNYVVAYFAKPQEKSTVFITPNYQDSNAQITSIQKTQLSPEDSLKVDLLKKMIGLLLELISLLQKAQA